MRPTGDIFWNHEASLYGIHKSGMSLYAKTNQQMLDKIQNAGLSTLMTWKEARAETKSKRMERCEDQLDNWKIQTPKSVPYEQQNNLTDQDLVREIELQSPIKSVDGCQCKVTLENP